MALLTGADSKLRMIIRVVRSCFVKTSAARRYRVLTAFANDSLYYKLLQQPFEFCATSTRALVGL